MGVELGFLHEVLLDSRVLRKTFGPKREGVMTDWRKLHNEKLCDLYCSQI
jgi:hypothetical protein